jgi:hypothetical protein
MALDNLNEEVTAEQLATAVTEVTNIVNLANEVAAKMNLTEEDCTLLIQYADYIDSMLSKEWFSSTLTPEEKIKLEALSSKLKFIIFMK